MNETLTSCRPEDADREETRDGNYFVATYPPFSVWTTANARKAADWLGGAPEDAAKAPLGLYVHLPFCAKRCDYCYYLSYADKTRTQQEHYVDALIGELECYERCRLLNGRSLSFVYFGGGTPSMLDERLIERLLGGLQSIFPWNHVEEASFECAPRSVTPSKLALLHEQGVTRISLGVQTLDDDILRRNGRIHLRKDVESAYDLIRSVGFEVVNLDLMVGLRGESEESLAATLAAVVEMAPESVTIYQTEIPHNTPLYRAECSGVINGPMPTWTVKRARLARAFSLLEVAGYTIRSAYAAVRDPRKHRFVYQDEQYHGADLLGIGVASFSYLAGVHYQNCTAYEAYMTTAASGELPIERAHVLSDEERLTREFVLQLKLGRVDAAYFRNKFDVDLAQRFGEALRSCEKAGWLTSDPSGVTLTRQGLLRVDRLIPAFYLPEHRGVRYA